MVSHHHGHHPPSLTPSFLHPSQQQQQRPSCDQGTGQYRQEPHCWFHDVIALTGNVIHFLESQIRLRYGGDETTLLREFHRGNDQINYGYTDKGLNKANSNDMINFNELGTQLSYVYRFFASHVLITGELLLSSSGWNGVRFPPLKYPAVSDLYRINYFLDTLSYQDHVRAMCFGGGPVSEVAAVTAWLRNEGVVCPLTYTVLDKYRAWAGVAGGVANFCDVSLEYNSLDFLSRDPELLAPLVSSQHILCLSKFLSALTAHRTAVATNLELVLRYMCPGALLIYIDNSGGGTTEMLSKVAEKCHFHEVFSLPHFNANIHPDVLSPNEQRSFYHVKATCNLNIAFKMFQKEGNIALPSTMSGSAQFRRAKFYHRLGNSAISF